MKDKSILIAVALASVLASQPGIAQTAPTADTGGTAITAGADASSLAIGGVAAPT